MKAHGKAQPFPGPKLYQRRAEVALPLLVRQAQAHEPIPYQALAREMGMKNPRNLNYVLGSVGHTLRLLEQRTGWKIPPIQTIVVNKHTDMPGSGGQWFAMGDKYATFDTATRRLRVEQRHQETFAYAEWPKVLSELNLTPVDLSFEMVFTAAAASGRGGGESERHKALKEEVRLNPHLAGFGLLAGPGTSEYALPSGDWLDVCFETDELLAAVEVKTIASSDADLTRGLFQCIKYPAVMEKMVALRRTGQRVSCRLLVEGRLPPALLPIKNALGINVVELGRTS